MTPEQQADAITRKHGAFACECDDTTSGVPYPCVACKELRTAVASAIDQRDELLKLAKDATNGWACYAKRKIELDDIARLHAAIAKAEGRTLSPTSALSSDRQETDR